MLYRDCFSAANGLLWNEKDSSNIVDNDYRYGLRTLPLHSYRTRLLLLSVTIFLYDGYYFSSVLCHFSLIAPHKYVLLFPTIFLYHKSTLNSHTTNYVKANTQ